jgi:hypothetical protein
MSGILYELEEAIVLFVKERVPSHKWKYLTHRFAIVGLMEDDDVNELKEHFFAELMNAVKWSSVVNEIAEMTENKEEQEELWDDDING